jgi:hypothetical protein
MGDTVTEGKVAEIDVLSDPARLGALTSRYSPIDTRPYRAVSDSSKELARR